MKIKIPLRKIILALIPILAIAGALAVYSILPKDNQILLEGSVEIASTTCFAQVGGKVASVLVQPGQSVGQGEVLAILDDSTVDDQVALLRQTLAIKEAQLQQLQAPLNMDAQQAARRAAQANVSLWEENLAQAQSQLRTAQQALAEQQTLYDAGAIALIELRQYEQAVESAESQVVTTQAQLSAARNSVQAIALPIADEQAIAVAQADLDLIQLQIDQLEQSRLYDNSTLKQLDIQEEMLDKAVKITKLANVPSLAVNAAFLYTALGNDGRFFRKEAWNPYAYAGLQLNIPIFAGNAKRAATRQARLNLSSLQLQRENVERQLRVAMIQNLNTMDTSVRQFGSSAATVAQAKRGYDIAVKRYEVGSGTLVEIDNSQLALTQAELSRNQSIYNFLTSKIALDKILGDIEVENYTE